MSCLICVREDDTRMFTTTCRHKYHEACLKEWLSHTRNCPICRTSVNETIPKEGMKNETIPKEEMKNQTIPNKKRRTASCCCWTIEEEREYCYRSICCFFLVIIFIFLVIVLIKTVRDSKL